jgi:hypothetical protein
MTSENQFARNEAAVAMLVEIGRLVLMCTASSGAMLCPAGDLLTLFWRPVGIVKHGYGRMTAAGYRLSTCLKHRCQRIDPGSVSAGAQAGSIRLFELSGREARLSHSTLSDSVNTRAW